MDISSVDYDATDIDDIKEDIHKYLMKKIT